MASRNLHTGVSQHFQARSLASPSSKSTLLPKQTVKRFIFTMVKTVSRLQLISHDIDKRKWDIQ